MKSGIVRKKWKTLLALGLFVPTIMGAFGCTDKEAANSNDAQVKEDELVYVPAFYELNADITHAAVLGDTLYYGTSNQKFYKMQLEDSYERETIPIPEVDLDVADVQIQPMPNGSLYVIYSVWSGQTDSEGYTWFDTWLAGYDALGTQLFCRDITEEVGENGTTTVVDEEGHLFFLTGDETVVTFDTDGTYGQTVQTEGACALVKSSDGTVYMLSDAQTAGYNNGTVREIAWESAQVAQEYTGMVTGNNSTGYLESGCLTRFDGKIYYYDFETQQNTQFLNLADCNITDGSVCQMDTLTDGRIVLLLNEETGDGAQAAVLTQMAKKDLPDYQTITLGTLSASTTLMDAVAKFNRQHSEYHVELREYYDEVLDESLGDEAKSQAYTNLSMDMVSGDCPDILNLDYEEIEAYAGKGIFADLNTYLEESNLEIYSSIAQAYTFDGELAAVPATVRIRTLVGKTSDFADTANLTLAQMMELPETYAGKKIFSADPLKLLTYCLTFNQETFVDFENKTCSYTCEEFYQILAFCKQFESSETNTNTTVWGVEFDGADALLYEVQIDAPDDVNLLMQMFETDSISFVGYPTLDGSAGHLLEAKNGAYAITKQSENKEAAWAFIESLLQGTGKKYTGLGAEGFPVEVSALEYYLELAMQDPCDDHGNRSYSVTDIDNIRHYVPLAEEVGQIKQLMETATVARGMTSQMSAIIEEEAADYFNGQKSAEETAKQIQNRVSIYLQEND